jgi:hypothetical protein
MLSAALVETASPPGANDGEADREMEGDVEGEAVTDSEGLTVAWEQVPEVKPAL